MTIMNQAEILETLAEDTHALWAQSFVDKVNLAFGVSLICHEYAAGGGPKGLTTNDGANSARGLASFDIAPMLCGALGVKYEAFLGRGFQVRACVKALREAGYGKA